MLILEKFVKVNEIPTVKLWCYMSPLKNLTNPWHADAITDLFFHLDEMCPKNFVKLTKKEKKTTLKTYPLIQLKTLVERQ
jgi:hypothetical protein